MNPAVADPLVGSIVAGRYKITRLIGKGGMGKIYEVQHLKLRRAFAMKKLSVELAGHPEALARFQREAEAIASLRHPNVVTVTDWETLRDGAPAMIMELLRGRDLDQHLQAGPMAWPSIGRVADEVMSALSVAHKAGIVHRDLKPQNIFLAEDDAGQSQAKLLDFGVSKMRQDNEVLTTQEGERLLGTPAYMSPEQANGEMAQVGPASDVWAMGAILYEMASGKRAFAAHGTPQVLYRICHGTPDALAGLRPDAPPAFVELVTRALSRDSALRTTSIDRLRRELRDALSPIAPGAFTEPLAAHAAPAPAQPVSRANAPTVLGTELVQLPPRRSPRWMISVSAAAITIIVASTLALLLTNRQPPRPPPAPAIAPAPAPPPVAATPPPPPASPPAPEPAHKKHPKHSPSRKSKPPGPLLP